MESIAYNQNTAKTGMGVNVHDVFVVKADELDLIWGTLI